MTAAAPPFVVAGSLRFVGGAIPLDATDEDPTMRVRYRMFQSRFASREKVCDKAADFASTLTPDRLVSITYTEYKDDGCVTVWYWADEGEAVSATRETEQVR
jgi:hypothetical protein